MLSEQDPSYASASVSEPIHFRSREPSVMQCLASWVVRSVDEVRQSSLTSVSFIRLQQVSSRLTSSALEQLKPPASRS